MKTMLIGILSLFCAISLTSCSNSCDGVKYGKAPRRVSGKTVEFTYTATTGFFENLEGKKLYATFDDNSLTYQMKTENGSFFSSGSYVYRKVGPNKADLIMTSASGLREFNKLNLRLKFTGCDEGDFQGELSQGAAGRQKGEFEIRS